MEWDVEKLSNSKWTKKIMGIVLLLLVALLSFNKISVVTSALVNIFWTQNYKNYSVTA